MPKNNTKSKDSFLDYWIPGSGKTEIAKSIKPFIVKKYGKRHLFLEIIRETYLIYQNLIKNRIKYALSYSQFSKYL